MRNSIKKWNLSTSFRYIVTYFPVKCKPHFNRAALLTGAQLVFAPMKNAAVIRHQINGFAHYYSIVKKYPCKWISFFSETPLQRNCFYTHWITMIIIIDKKIKMHAKRLGL